MLCVCAIVNAIWDPEEGIRYHRTGITICNLRQNMAKMTGHSSLVRLYGKRKWPITSVLTAYKLLCCQTNMLAHAVSPSLRTQDYEFKDSNYENSLSYIVRSCLKNTNYLIGFCQKLGHSSSSRRPEFDSQHQHGGSQLTVTLVPGAGGTAHNTCRQTPTLKNKYNFKREFSQLPQGNLEITSSLFWTSDEDYSLNLLLWNPAQRTELNHSQCEVMCCVYPLYLWWYYTIRININVYDKLNKDHTNRHANLKGGRFKGPQPSKNNTAESRSNPIGYPVQSKP